MYGGVYGRFTTPDPLAASAKRIIPQSWNRYSYVLNNPLLFVDPSGMKWGYYDENGRRHFHYFKGDAGKYNGHTYQNYTGPMVVSNTNAKTIRLLSGGGFRVLGQPPQSTGPQGSSSSRTAPLSRPSGGNTVNHSMVRAIADHTEHVPEFVGVLAVTGVVGGVACAALCPATAGVTVLGFTEKLRLERAQQLLRQQRQILIKQLRC